MQLLVELLKGGIVELSTVVGYDDLSQAEAINDTCLDKVIDIFLSDLGKWLSLNPLGKVVDYHNKKFSLPNGLQKRTKDVHLPLSEWPTRAD